MMRNVRRCRSEKILKVSSKSILEQLNVGAIFRELLGIIIGSNNVPFRIKDHESMSSGNPW
ncbi:hypothetical protein ACS0TY_002049 [Phlomoides rotata]